MSTSAASHRRRIWLSIGWILALGLGALACRLPPDGHEHAALAQFIGRLHPAVLHLPIALFLLVPLFEFLGRTEPRTHLREAAGFVLALAAAAALVVAFDGWLLAWAGGYKSPLVTRHMWGGAAFAALTVLCATLRGGAHRPDALRDSAREGLAPHRSTPAHPKQPVPLSAPYVLCLVVSLGVLGWASHNGGKLSHGDTFLTQYMPTGLKKVFHIRVAPERRATAAGTPNAVTAGAKTLYAVKIQPILNHSCVSCHGPQKVKGGLRLDTYAALMKGGDTGSEIDPWRPQTSELIRRITLPPDDDDFMPNNGKNLLTADQKALITNWILAGASDRQPLP